MDERITVKQPDYKKLIEFLLRNPTFVPPGVDLTHAGEEKGLLAWLYNLIFGH